MQFTFSTARGKDTSGEFIKTARISTETKGNLYSALFIQGIARPVFEVNGNFVDVLPTSPNAKALGALVSEAGKVRGLVLAYLHTPTSDVAAERAAWWAAKDAVRGE